jgi:hypothetical protein
MFVQQEKTYNWVDNSTPETVGSLEWICHLFHRERVVPKRQFSLKHSLIQQGAPSCAASFALENLFLNYNPDLVTGVNN